MSWRDDPRGYYIRMHSGEKVYLLDPSPTQIRIPDVVHHSARVNRYTGADTFTIGQHMVVGARLAARFYPEHDLLPARFLVHDVAEHILNDMSSPLKQVMGDYKALETRWEYAVEQKFGVTFIGDALVKELDTRMWLTERQSVYAEAIANGIDMSEDVRDIDLEPFDLDDDEFERLFLPWTPYQIEEAYEDELARLIWPV